MGFVCAFKSDADMFTFERGWQFGIQRRLMEDIQSKITDLIDVGKRNGTK